MLGGVNASPELSDILVAWRGRMRSAAQRAWLAAALGVFLVAMLSGRQGTAATRLFAAGLLLAFLGCALGQWWWRRRRARHPLGEAIGIVRKVDQPLAKRLRRAVGLVERTHSHDERVSRELAELHLQRLLAQVPVALIESRATTQAARVKCVATGLLLAGLGVAATQGASLSEGFDVLLARHGMAPLSMQLLEIGPILVQPPAYLQAETGAIEFEGPASLPQGCLLTIHGVPRQEDRRLVLTDGQREVPFVHDAQGGVTAQYLLQQSARLRVAARFGQVLIPQDTEASIEAIIDRPPEVELDSAPKRVSIAEISELELRYHVADEHGIRQVDLVLRSGTREERRSLVRLDGKVQRHTGAHVLGMTDSFVVNGFGSVDVFVAARDDNNLSGANWGQSAVMTLDQPSLGHSQVQRYRRFDRLRRQLVDWFASFTAVERNPADLQRIQGETRVTFAEVAAGFEADKGAKRALSTFLRAQRNKLFRGEQPREFSAKTLSEVLLSVDATAEAIARRDAEQVARRLADVAVEIETGAKTALSSEQRDEGVVRVRTAMAWLASGAAELKQLGTLGDDLGEIAQAGWGRINKVFVARDFENVRRAAAFLAERLRRPMPSFVGGGRAGVESRSVGRGQGNRPRASEADQHLERVIVELQQLVREHASEVASLERVLGDAERAAVNEDLRPEARRHADAMRRLVEALPPLGAEPGSARATLALGKELVQGAAESLEQLRLVDAHAGLQKADAALAEAELLLGADHALTPAMEPNALAELRQRLTVHRDWVRRMLDTARGNSLKGSRDQLRLAGDRERELSDRAGRLAQRESKGDAVLPEDMRGDLEQASRLMRRASELLDQGRGPLALDQQRNAQKLLEREAPEPDPQQRSPASDGGRDDSNADARHSARGGKVVSTSDTESREDFRRRVQQGLSKEVQPDLSPAVRRYAEGLLK